MGVARAVVTRAAIVATARSWIDTPYRHQASEKGVGADCLGLVRGVWRELYGQEPERAPPYAPDWAEAGAAETLRDAARRHLRERPLGEARAGDVLLFRIRTDAPAKHAAILAAAAVGGQAGRLVHAYWGRAVAETALTPWWARRAAYAFSFPNVVD
jgi:NlpC/P60 family putative phage cell wall peptidase